MRRSRILVRTLFGFILLAGLIAGFFLPPLIFVDAAPQAAYLPLSVVINEVAWGGTAASSSDEWMELYNPSLSDIDLSNWKIVRKSISLPVTTIATITIPVGKTILAHGYFLLERADKAVSDIPADYVYGGTNISNPSCYLPKEVDAGGENKKSDLDLKSFGGNGMNRFGQ